MLLSKKLACGKGKTINIAEITLPGSLVLHRYYHKILSCNKLNLLLPDSSLSPSKIPKDNNINHKNIYNKFPPIANTKTHFSQINFEEKIFLEFPYSDDRDLPSGVNDNKANRKSEDETLIKSTSQPDLTYSIATAPPASRKKLLGFFHPSPEANEDFLNASGF